MPGASLGRIVIAVAVLTAFVAKEALGDAPTASAEQAPSVQVAPASAGPGEAIALSGSGWPAGSSVIARLYEASNVGGPSATVGTGSADSAGNVAIQGTVPNTLFGSGSRGNLNVVPGSYTLIAATEALSTTVPFTVAAPSNAALLWGEVYLDIDGDGVRSGADIPWVVEVTAINAVHASPLLKAITDSRGRYVLSGIAPGYYAVSSQADYQSSTWTGKDYGWATGSQVTRVDLLLRRPPPVVHPDRCFDQTGFCVEDDAFWQYFQARGGVRTFGYPVSRVFRLSGFQTQFFQRVALQKPASGGVQRLNTLDPGLMPYNRINGSTFPPHDPAVAAAAPRPDTPDYGGAVLRHLRATVPDVWEGVQVSFLQTFLSAAPTGASNLQPLLALEILGFPTSQPMRDPNNCNFIYQRFQRGILHYQGTDARGNPITSAVLLVDWLKSLMTGQGLPDDLAAQARAGDSPYLSQYCSDSPNWLCRPDALPDTDLTWAFFRQR